MTEWSLTARRGDGAAATADADFFRSAFVAAAVALARLSAPPHRVLDANPRFCALTGLAAGALRGRLLSELAGIADTEGPAATPGEPATLRWPSPDGEGRWVRATLSPLPGGEAVLAVEDIDAATRHASDVAARAEQVGLALDAAGLGHWNWDIARDAVALTDRAAALFGFPPGSAPRREEIRERLHPEDAARAQAVIEAAIASGTLYAVEYRIRAAPGQRETWLSVCGQGSYGEDGALRGMVGIVQDVTDREEARRALNDREQRLRVATTVADLGIFEWHVMADEALWENERMWEIFGRRPQDGTIGKGEFFQSVIHPDDLAGFRAAVMAATQGDGVFHATCRIARGIAREWRTIDMAGRIERDGPGGLPGRLIGVVADVTDRTRAEERQALLIRELHHRVKNTLATVQAIVGSTARTASSIDSFYEAFVGRIMSLAHTHSVLTEDTWQTASLRTLLESELRPYADGGMERSETARISLDGPPVDLASEIAVPIGMAIHELTTNAAKYGALSNRTGRVEVEWRVEDESARSILHFAWSESGGPEVRKPTRRGFGTRLLQRVLTTQVQAVVDESYEPSGFRLTMRAPLPERNPALNPLA